MWYTYVALMMHIWCIYWCNKSSQVNGGLPTLLGGFRTTFTHGRERGAAGVQPGSVVERAVL